MRNQIIRSMCTASLHMALGALALIAPRAAAQATSDAPDTAAIIQAVHAVHTDTLTGRCSWSPEGGVVRDTAAAVSDAQRCAADRLTRRVQARLGATEALAYDAVRRGFVIASSGRLLVPSPMTFAITDREVRALTVLSVIGGPNGTAVITAPVPSTAETPDATLQGQTSGNRTADSMAGAPAAPERKKAPARTQGGAAGDRATIRGGLGKVGSGIGDAVVGGVRVAGKVLAAPYRFFTRPKAPNPFVLVSAGDLRVIAGRSQAVPASFSVQLTTKSASTDSIVRRGVTGPLQAACTADEPVIVASASVQTDGTVACWLRLTEKATTKERYTAHLKVLVDGKSVETTFRVPVLPATSYAIRAEEKDCRDLVIRVKRLLVERGVPVVSYDRATRRADLQSCQRFDRLLPVGAGDVAPQGVMILGAIREAGIEEYDQPARVGDFTVTTSKPGSDPYAEAAKEIVERLLKYIAL